MIVEIGNIAINVFQSIVVTMYLIQSLGRKNEEISTGVSFIVGSVGTFSYLEVLSNITDFESVGIFIYCVFSFIFCVVFLGGSIGEKLFVNVILVGILVFSALIGGGIGSMLYDMDYISYTKFDENGWLIGAVLSQGFLVLFLLYVVKLRKSIKEIQDRSYMLIASFVPVISVVVCCFIISNNRAQLFLAIIGIVVMNAFNVQLLSIEHKVYEQKVKKETLLSAYEMQQMDLEEIKQLSIETDKTKHEMNRVLRMLGELLENKEYGKAESFLKDFVEVRKVNDKSVIYTDNIILNYMLNRKLNECEKNDIRMNCLITGEITGISDIDIYILLGNLIDNAIEAVALSEDKRISVILYSDESTVGIEVGNSVKQGIMKNNLELVSTKKNKEKHGYGMKNVMDIVERYNGTFYKNISNEDYYICRIILIKNYNSRRKSTVHDKNIVIK